MALLREACLNAKVFCKRLAKSTSHFKPAISSSKTNSSTTKRLNQIQYVSGCTCVGVCVCACTPLLHTHTHLLLHTHTHTLSLSLTHTLSVKKPSGTIELTTAASVHVDNDSPLIEVSMQSPSALRLLALLFVPSSPHAHACTPPPFIPTNRSQPRNGYGSCSVPAHRKLQNGLPTSKVSAVQDQQVRLSLPLPVLPLHHT